MIYHGDFRFLQEKKRRKCQKIYLGVGVKSHLTRTNTKVIIQMQIQKRSF